MSGKFISGLDISSCHVDHARFEANLTSFGIGRIGTIDIIGQVVRVREKVEAELLQLVDGPLVVFVCPSSWQVRGLLKQFKDLFGRDVASMKVRLPFTKDSFSPSLEDFLLTEPCLLLRVCDVHLSYLTFV